MGTAVTLLIVDPARQTPEAEATEALASAWQRLAAERGLEPRAVVARPAIEGWGELAEPLVDGGLPELAGVIVLGSAASVHDDDAWRRPLDALIGRLLAGQQRTPFFGICYAHQLVAKLAGAEVVPVTADGSKLLRVLDVELDGAPEQLFGPERASFRVAVSHYECVASAPAGFRVWASHETCAVHGLALEGAPLWTVQGHPEMPDVALERLGLAAPRDAQRDADGEALLTRFMRFCLD